MGDIAKHVTYQGITHQFTMQNVQIYKPSVLLFIWGTEFWRII